MTELRRRMTDDMVVRRMAEATQEAYLSAVVGLARFYRRSPDQITEAEVQAYLLHLIRERQRAWSTCNIVVHGLRFFYHVTLKQDRATFSIPGGRQPSKLPEILSREEIQRLIAATDSPKERALVTTAYATGLRVKELVHDNQPAPLGSGRPARDCLPFALARVGRKSPRVTPAQPYNPHSVRSAPATRFSSTGFIRAGPHRGRLPTPGAARMKPYSVRQPERIHEACSVGATERSI